MPSITVFKLRELNGKLVDALNETRARVAPNGSEVSTKHNISTSSPIQSGELGENEILLPRFGYELFQKIQKVEYLMVYHIPSL